ncbi:hypothetical protein [Streptomyces sp. ODS05-4]|uniref:hypothetical protein n=1 Tax=Streptomyces sp. ODS05-4 TaxID=2944939 RepID=UPI00210DD34A|nr:hypothetical protein [Streptomyces sp. ODS05-4]
MLLAAGAMLLRGLAAARASLPFSLRRAADHPAMPAWVCGLTVAQCLVLLDVSLPALMWVAAAAAMVGQQRRPARGFLVWAAATARAVRQPAGALVAGAVVCAVSLFLPWGRGGYFLGGFQNYHTRDRTFDGFTSEYTDRWGMGFNMMTNWVDLPVDGRHRPLAALALLALGVLLVALRGMTAGAPRAWTVLLPAAVVSVWGLTGASGEPGFWVFLVGAVVMDAAAVRAVLRLRGPSA